MTGSDEQLGARLRDALVVPTDAATRATQLAALTAALTVAPASSVTARERPRSFRRVIAIVTAVAVVGVPSVAVAAESSLPGSPLWRVKVTTEPVRAVVDRDVVLRHRVEELERLLVNGAEVQKFERALERADAAVRDDSAPSLVARLDVAREAVAAFAPAPDPDLRGDVEDTPSKSPVIPSTGDNTGKDDQPDTGDTTSSDDERETDEREIDEPATDESETDEREIDEPATDETDSQPDDDDDGAADDQPTDDPEEARDRSDDERSEESSDDAPDDEADDEPDKTSGRTSAADPTKESDDDEPDASSESDDD